jgi:hypothetical protein
VTQISVPAVSKVLGMMVEPTPSLVVKKAPSIPTVLELHSTQPLFGLMGTGAVAAAVAIQVLEALVVLEAVEVAPPALVEVAVVEETVAVAGDVVLDVVTAVAVVDVAVEVGVPTVVELVDVGVLVTAPVVAPPVGELLSGAGSDEHAVPDAANPKQNKATKCEAFMAAVLASMVFHFYPSCGTCIALAFETSRIGRTRNQSWFAQ